MEEDKESKEIKEEAKTDIKEEIKADVLSSQPEPNPEPKIPAIKTPVFPSKKPSFNWWALGALVFFLLFLAALFTNGFGFTGITGMSTAEVGDKAITYLNEELLPADTEATLISIEPKSGVYNIKIEIDGEDYDSYITKDGNLLFISGIDLAEKQETEPTGFDAPNSEKPLVQLFIMSFCPYGQQAENNIVSTMDLLKDHVIFEPHFIASVSDGAVSSLHGSKEADEDMRQACIWKYYPESWWDYVMYVNENIPFNNINEQWKSAAESTELDIESIEKCVEQEGLELMKADNALTDELGITGSPTLLINGEKYTGQRTPEAFKQAICSAFEQAPEACLEELEASSSSPEGTC